MPSDAGRSGKGTVGCLALATEFLHVGIQYMTTVASQAWAVETARYGSCYKRKPASPFKRGEKGVGG